MAHSAAGRRAGRSTLWLLFVVVGLALGLGFLAGYGVAVGLPQTVLAPAPPWAAASLSASPTVAAAEAADASSGAQSEATGADFALLYEMRGLIETEYYRPTNTDRQKLLYGAARGMVGALGDPNSVYETPAERLANDSRWSGRYEGVGMFVDQRDGQLVVTAPIEGGPADRAGVRPGDSLLEADGRNLAGLTLIEQTLLLRGPKGSTVTLTIRRQGVAELLRIPVVRDEVRLISARGQMLDNRVGVLRISQFTEGTLEEARLALEGVLAAQPVGLLLDLRANPGGLLQPAVQVTGLFLGGGPVVVEAHADGEQKTYAANDGTPLTDLPLIVLVDRGTASASEVIAAALRDRGRATLLGERTFGKNTVQYIHRLSEGSGLRITVAEWHTPSGQPIPATGLDPDWPVPSPTTPVPNQDPVLDAAARRLLAQIGVVGN